MKKSIKQTCMFACLAVFATSLYAQEADPTERGSCITYEKDDFVSHMSEVDRVETTRESCEKTRELEAKDWHPAIRKVVFKPFDSGDN